MAAAAHGPGHRLGTRSDRGPTRLPQGLRVSILQASSSCTGKLSERRLREAPQRPACGSFMKSCFQEEHLSGVRDMQDWAEGEVAWQQNGLRDLSEPSEDLWSWKGPAGLRYVETSKPGPCPTPPHYLPSPTREGTWLWDRASLRLRAAPRLAPA